MAKKKEKKAGKHMKKSELADKLITFFRCVQMKRLLPNNYSVV